MKILHLVIDFLRYRPKWGSFLLVFSIILFLNLSQPQPFVFYYDSGYYWDLSTRFVKEGIFSLTNYDNSLRGYLFPLIIFVIKKLASIVNISDYIVYEVIMSLIYAIFLTIWVPGLIQLLFQKQVKFPQSVVFSIFALFFWRGSFFYPLSDLLAFLLLILGVYIIFRFPKQAWWTILAGAFWGGATIIRPIYQITLFPLLLWMIYYYRKEINFNPRTILLRSMAIFAGLIIVFTPQILINFTNFGKFSPFIVAQDLFTLQLERGILMQKYESNIGSDYPDAPVVFLDKQGESILLKSGYKVSPNSESGTLYSDKPFTLRKYLGLVYRHPLDFLCIYLRHLFNGLDIVYDTVYIENVYDSALPIRFTNYSIWFLVVMYFIHTLQKINVRSIWNSRFFIPLIFSLPSIVSIPTSIEVRFMLPIHLMAYALVAIWILPVFFQSSLMEKKNLVSKYIIGYIIFVTFCFFISSNTYMGLQYGSYLLS